MKSSFTNLTEKFKNINLIPNGEPNMDTSERILSAVAGTYLLYKSFKNIGKHPILAAHGAAASGLLLYRGVVGVCPIYQKLKSNIPNPQSIHTIHQMIEKSKANDLHAAQKETRIGTHHNEQHQIKPWLEPGASHNQGKDDNLNHTKEDTYLNQNSPSNQY